ncbi:MAG: acetylornithine deacetylase [Moraxella sp.]|nr:acetylornithine deacetylase [Moraxella sp.]
MSYPSTSSEWLIRLIGFPTISSQSNLALIEDVAQYLRSFKIEPVLTLNSDNTKANLFATIANINDEHEGKQGGIVLSGHSDVVPVANQAWTRPPFVAWVDNERIYGRGACDMKGFIACMLAFVPTAVSLAKENRLKTPLHLAISFDEEVGCLGAPLLLEDLKTRGVHPDYCIVGEPTNMQMVVAHKGINVYTCRVHGRSAHSSLTHQGVNAISYAAKMIGFIDQLAEELKHHQEVDEEFDVPYATLSVGTISGGTATNIVPNLCEFSFDYRNLPTMSLEEVLTPIHEHAKFLSKQMQQVDAQTGIDITQTEKVPAMTDKDSAKLQALVSALLTNQPTNKKAKVAYATEGGQFTNAGIATIICGPGSIEQAHRADEYVAISQLDKCDALIRRLFC